MGALFGFLMIVVLVAMVVGLVKPKLVLPTKFNPTRLKVVGAYSVVFVVVVAVGMAVSPPPKKGGEATVVAPEPSAPAPVRVAKSATIRSVGVSPENALRTFVQAGYGMAEIPDDRGHWVGNGRFGIADVIAREEGVSELSLVLGGATTNADAMKCIAEMLAMLELTFPDWPERGTWLKGAIQAGGANVSRQGNMVTYEVIKPIGIALSIKAE